MAEHKVKLKSLRKLNIKLNGKDLYKSIYRTAKGVTDSEIRDIAQKTADSLNKHKPGSDFQVSIVYANLGIRSSKFTKTGQRVKVNDESDSDFNDMGEIIGFTLTFTL